MHFSCFHFTFHLVLCVFLETVVKVHVFCVISYRSTNCGFEWIKLLLPEMSGTQNIHLLCLQSYGSKTFYDWVLCFSYTTIHQFRNTNLAKELVGVSYLLWKVPLCANNSYSVFQIIQSKLTFWEMYAN